MKGWEVLCCPDCGGRFETTPASLVCVGCGLTGILNENVATFPHPLPEPAKTPERPLRTFLQKIDSGLHPLRGRFSPLRWYADRHLKRYYDRCLGDPALAEEFRRHYLPEAVPGRAALDVGCGRGRITALLTQLGFQVVGLDLSPHPFWRKIQKATFIVSPGNRLPFRDATFDLITHFQVLMYVKDPQSHLGEIHRVLKGGGYASFQVPNRNCLRMLFAGRFGDTDFYRPYSRDELISLLKGTGFRVERMSSEMFYAPIFPQGINFLRRVLLAKDFDLFDRGSLLVRLTPPRYRGLINAIARKV